MPATRSQQKNVYHECARCGVRFPLSQLQWQNGQLFCSPNRCIDTALQGSRDLKVARQLSIDRKEMQPDQKLTNPTVRRDGGLDVLY